MTQAMKDSDREVVRLDDDRDGFDVKQGLPNVGGITSYSGASILTIKCLYIAPLGRRQLFSHQRGWLSKLVSYAPVLVSLP